MVRNDDFYCFISLLISTVFAVIIGTLYYFALIPGIITAAWIAFGLGVLNLIFLIIGLYIVGSARNCSALFRCMFSKGICYLIGIIGTLITTIIFLSLNPAITIGFTILVAIGAFFFALMLIQLILLIICIWNKLFGRNAI